MMFFGNNRSQDREYLFIDGGSLRSAVKALSNEIFGDGELLRPHIPGLFQINRVIHKVFYYDAIPGKDYNETELNYETRVQADHDRFAKIQALDRVHVALGSIVGRNRRQKGVDVRLAVDMMTHAFRGNMSRATLFAGDADFIPLVRALVSEGLQVTLWHPKQANDELKGAADTTRLFDFSENLQCFTYDDAKSAFQMVRAGDAVIPPFQDGASQIVEIEGKRYAGKWVGNEITIWQEETGAWTMHQYRVDVPSLSHALAAIQQITQWPVASGESWITR